MPQSFKLGWKRQSYVDERDLRFKAHPRVTATLPPSVYLTKGMGPRLDQGDLGSCGPNSVDECWMYDDNVQGLRVQSQSRLFIYGNARGWTSTDDGVENRAMLKSLAKYGSIPESMWPYDITKFAVKPEQSYFAAALSHRISNYAVVNQILGQMKGCVASHFPFIFGFTVFPSMMTDVVATTGLVPNPGKLESPAGGHDVTICGYFDRKWMPDGTRGAFLFRNHWKNNDGSWWGDPKFPGCGWISYKYATDTNLVGDFWVINSVA